MEWKEHIGWFAPILATAVAFVVAQYGPQLAQQQITQGAALDVCRRLLLFGAFINKVTPIR